MSSGRPRQANIKTEEAHEIGKLVRNRYKIDKTIWGKRFWRKLEGSGVISKQRTAETLRNFVRNVSTGKARFKWDDLFPGIPIMGEHSKTFNFWVSRRKAILEKWNKDDLVRAVTSVLAEKFRDFDDCSLWKRFMLKHNFEVYSPQKFQNLFEALDTSLLIEVGVPELHVRQLELIFLEDDRPVRDNFEDPDSVDTKPEDVHLNNGPKNSAEISKNVSEIWDYIFNAQRPPQTYGKILRRTEKAMNASARLFCQLSKINPVNGQAKDIKAVLLGAVKHLNNKDQPQLQDLAVSIINTLKIARNAIEFQEGAD